MRRNETNAMKRESSHAPRGGGQRDVGGNVPRPLRSLIVVRNHLRTVRLVIQDVAVEVGGTVVNAPGADLSEERTGVLERVARVDGGRVPSQCRILPDAGILVQVEGGEPSVRRSVGAGRDVGQSVLVRVDAPRRIRPLDEVGDGGEGIHGADRDGGSAGDEDEEGCGEERCLLHGSLHGHG